MKQTIITNGCLQIIYVNGIPEDNEPLSVKAYTECMDIYMVFEGSLSIKIFNHKKELNEGELFFCTQSTYQEITHCHKPVSYARLRFIKEKIPNTVLPKRFAASLLYSDIILNKIFNHCICFVDFYESNKTRLNESTAYLLHKENLEIITILEIMVAQQHENLDVIHIKVNKNTLLTQAIDLFESNNTPELLINDVAAKIGVSQAYFIDLFKRNIGIVPNVLWRTIKANNVLSSISLNMTSLCDISYLLGVTDQSDFTTCFKNQAEIPPINQ